MLCLFARGFICLTVSVIILNDEFTVTNLLSLLAWGDFHEKWGTTRSLGSCITPHPPGISYFPFHGPYLPHLDIINRVPLKINCSHLKTQFFITFDLFVIFNKAICISYVGRAGLIMSSLSLLLVHPECARHKNRD